MSTAIGGFEHVSNWVFDLDNTLYPAECRLFDQIDQRMGSFIASKLDVDRVQARLVQKDYFARYGTTLRGLMQEHGTDPGEFLSFVHDIDHSPVKPDQLLAQAISNLGGKKYVFTNGTVAHAKSILDRIGIYSLFDGIFDICAAGYAPKPDQAAYNKFISDTGISPAHSAMFEDLARNLKVPHELGMKTVYVHDEHNIDAAFINNLDGLSCEMPHIHHTTDDLCDFLSRVAGQ